MHIVVVDGFYEVFTLAGLLVSRTVNGLASGYAEENVSA